MRNPFFFSLFGDKSEFAFFGAAASVVAPFLWRKRMIITFFGHSDYCAKKADEERLLSFLEETVGVSPVTFYLGGYGAFDSFARDCARKFQRAHINVKLVMVTPYLNKKVPLDLYDETVYPPLENIPPRFAISHRNLWMVEQANVVVVYVVRSFGGAAQAYAHARKQKKLIFDLSRQ